jgi:predicted nucleic-acid-binding protein
MLVVDSNVILRLLLRDDPAQEEKVKIRFQKLEKNGERVLLTAAVVLECLWILEFKKGLPRELVAEMLEGILSMEIFQVEGLSRWRRALHFYGAKRIDFVDAYLAGVSEESGNEGVLSFDRDMEKLGIHWVKP